MYKVEPAYMLGSSFNISTHCESQCENAYQFYVNVYNLHVSTNEKFLCEIKATCTKCT